jgi:hypothetical protein
MSAVMAALRDVGKVAAGAVPAALIARLGLPALGGLLFLGRPGAHGGLLGDRQLGPDRAGQPDAAGLAGQRRLPGPGRRCPAARPGGAAATPALVPALLTG